ncbi:VOC family protein [Terriglobus roseus]|uniref:Glyoxalase/Bleomycin resistance protein/Dioxygenase superfamily protein n=1 Tax=Terriglobus roseus TaxID=392734 RepID=A0A1G7HIN6_9BACT|nr:VOC family protein [Terriglobus roseus]SDF00186.1 Glyoxalase/Bleomycin resistance protein/Dioxygenase superfamily protein [Terriglobus roseus]
MPNIDNLKKQSKQYLPRHHDWYYPVAAQIRSTLPRFRSMGDVDILESAFKFADAQELVARQDSWRALLSGAHAMSDAPKQTPLVPILAFIEAQLFVANVQRSCEFYAEKLGFNVEFVYGSPSFYAQVRRDNARLNLRLFSEPVFVGDVRKREGLLSASISVATASEIKNLFLAFKAAGVLFQQTLKKEPWGGRRSPGVHEPSSFRIRTKTRSSLLGQLTSRTDTCPGERT